MAEYTLRFRDKITEHVAPLARALERLGDEIAAGHVDAETTALVERAVAAAFALVGPENVLIEKG